MALRVWLPLNGTLENKGILQLDYTINTNPTFVDNGKIGKAMSMGQITMSSANMQKIFANNTMSICFWVYVNADTGDTTKRSMFFGNNSPRRYSLFQYPSCNDLHWSWANDTTNNISGVYSGAFPSYQWTHCAVTYNGAKIRIYLNGELKQTTNASYSPVSLNYDTILFSNCANSGKYLNDYRIYDHCLSDKEVKEIAQGLILHYKLDEFNSGKIINWFGNGHYLYDCTYEPSSHPAYHVSHWGGSVRAGTTKDENYQNEGTVYVTFKTTENVGAVDWSAAGNIGLQYSKHQINPSDTRFNDMLPILMNINIGEYFTVSFESKCSDATYPYKIRTRIVTKLSSETSTTSTEINTTTFTTANSWDIYSATFQMTQTLYNRIHDSTNDRLILLFDIWYANTATMANNVTLELRKFQFELGNTRHEWERSMYDYGIMDVIVKDSSGYGYNGVVTGVPEINDNTSKYTNSIKFLKNTAYITLPAITYSNFGNSYTFSWWEYMTTVSGGPMPWGFSDGNRLNCYHTTNLCWNTGDGGNNPFTPTKTAASLVDNNWHHMVITGDGTTTKLYIDGSLWGNATTYKALTGTQIYISGWNTSTSYKMTGNSMSDFRIYATALSAEDILDLYHTSANIDNLGSLHGFEFNETQTNLVNSDLDTWTKESQVTGQYEADGFYHIDTHRSNTGSRYGIYVNLSVQPSTNYVFAIDMKDNNSLAGIQSYESTTSWSATRLTSNGEKRYYYYFTTGASDTVARIYLAVIPNTRVDGYFKNPYFAIVNNNSKINKNGIFNCNNLTQTNITPKIMSYGELDATDFIEK